MQKPYRIGQIVPSSNTTMETEIPARLLARQQIRRVLINHTTATQQRKRAVS